MGYRDYRRKLTIVGDDTVGKTCLVMSYTTGTFPNWIPGTYHNWVEDFEFGGKLYEVAFWDVYCSDEYARLRPLSYPDTDVFLLCFSLVDLSTYENIRTLWYPETAMWSPGSTYVLVGTKLDLREATTIESVSGAVIYEQGEAMAKEIGAVKYMECSAATGQNLKTVFEEALKIAVQRPPRKPSRSWRSCIIA